MPSLETYTLLEYVIGTAVSFSPILMLFIVNKIMPYSQPPENPVLFEREPNITPETFTDL